MFDIHAHLHDGAFDDDRDAVVARALDAGVEQIITIGTDIVESRKAVDCALKYEGVYASAGIHPHEMNHLVKIPNTKYQISNQSQNDQINEWIRMLRELARHKKVVAIGECGLDYFVHGGQGGIETTVVPPAGGASAVSEKQKIDQKELFIAQIDLAQELQLPLIIHCRPSKGSADAYEDMFGILSDSTFYIQHSTFILHCYMGDTEVTEKFLTLPNVYFSFTGNITYPTKKVLVGTRPACNAMRSIAGRNDLTEVVKMIPIERMLAETDCPYLPPVPHRGKRNEPAFVTEVVRKIAEIKGVSREIVEQTVTASAKTIFGI